MLTIISQEIIVSEKKNCCLLPETRNMIYVGNKEHDFRTDIKCLRKQ